MKMTRLLTVEDIAKFRHGPSNDIDLEVCISIFSMFHHSGRTPNIFLHSGNFCFLLISFANSLDPDQDQQNVSPDLDPNDNLPERTF